MDGIATQAGMARQGGGGGGGLLLDVVGPAAIAVSTKLLKSDYSGPCLRVRRSSDNAETDIGFSGENLDTAAILSHVSGGDGYVSSWYDQSGNGRDLTSTGSDQPRIALAGVIDTFSGEDAVFFDFNFLDSGAITMSPDIDGSGWYVGNVDSGMLSSEGTSGSFDALIRDSTANAYSGNQPIYRKNGVPEPTWVTRTDLINNLQGVDVVFGVTGYDYGTHYAGFRLGGRAFVLEGKLAACIIFDSDQSADYSTIDTILNNQFSVY